MSYFALYQCFQQVVIPKKSRVSLQLANVQNSVSLKNLKKSYKMKYFKIGIMYQRIYNLRARTASTKRGRGDLRNPYNGLIT